LIICDEGLISHKANVTAFEVDQQVDIRLLFPSESEKVLTFLAEAEPPFQDGQGHSLPWPYHFACLRRQANGIYYQMLLKREKKAKIEK
ncbi:hypothetical protein ACQP3L_33500, partial [Escherichia coli]